MESGDLGSIDVTVAHPRHLSLSMSSSILANITLPALTTLTLRGDISVDAVLSPIQHPGFAARKITIALDKIVEAHFTRLLSEVSALEVVAVLAEFTHTTAFIHRLFETSGCFTVLRMLMLKVVEAVDLASVIHVRDVRLGIVVMG
ncbi:hypothetical protein ARMSODRAFT_117007 [Armillaria solidipes]|uniref:Uncharacterized protein n=1 Tax=Armillaria solidipes TaxID=1076256 RepID=A0A2H3ALE5_9AGAR|nr:hypothetical protein ARMSODRAFT_117007 [Armillaria solidipes]